MSNGYVDRNELKFDPIYSTSNRSALAYLNNRCTCGSNEFVYKNLNTTSSVSNTSLQCLQCHRQWVLYYD